MSLRRLFGGRRRGGAEEGGAPVRLAVATRLLLPHVPVVRAVEIEVPVALHALGGEAVGEWVIGPFLAWRKADQPRWRRLAFFGLVFGAMAAGLIWIFVFQE